MQTTEANKLEIRHLAGYLPYELKGLIEYSDNSTEICTLWIRDWYNNKCDIDSFLNGTYPVKPILHPLSDLTKEITHKGETFVSMEQVKWFMPNTPSWDNIKDFTYPDLSQTIIEHCVFDKLTEWMFDVYGLIDQGIAIDVNTLSENPYK